MQHRHPSPAETQRGNDFLQPRPSGIKIQNWRPYRNAAGTMLGFLSIELPSGMAINDCKLMVGPNGTHWIAMPATKTTDRDGNPVVNRDGKPIWNDFVEFTSKGARERFQRQVIDALQAQHPEAPS